MSDHANTDFDHLVVLDFEATCEPGGAPTPQEVIEFPSVLIAVADGRVVDSFESFVRPVHHPALSAFCTELTGIQQADVDGAATFPEVAARHQRWLAGHGLLTDARFAFVTCGDWDLQTMLPIQCQASGPPITELPRAYRRWINVKDVFRATLRPRGSLGMRGMLDLLGLELIGRHHRGIDDCHNIARIVLNLLARGARFDVTRELPRSRYPHLPLELRWRDRVIPVVLEKRALPSLLGLASGAFRRQAIALSTLDGRAIDDALLLELAPGAALQVTLRGDS